MKSTQSKDIIGKIVISLSLFLIGEGVFNWGGYIVVLLLLPTGNYWYAFVLGLFLSALSSSVPGLASLILVLAVFVYGRVSSSIRLNPILLLVFGSLVNWLLDTATRSHWSFLEIVLNMVLVVVLAAVGFLKEEINLRV